MNVRPTLGSFRLLLAITVFFSHSTPGGVPWPWGIEVSGVQAVVMFFIVSGFLIGLALEQNYTGRSFAFLVNRFLRIYPAFWAVLALGYAAVALHGVDELKGAEWMSVTIKGWTLRDFVGAMVEMSKSYHLIPVIWSIAVEIHFYLVIAAVYWLLDRYKGPNAAVLKQAFLMVACYGFLVICLFYTAGQDLPYGSTAPYIPDFVLGVAISQAIAGSKWPWKWSPLIAISLLLAIVSFAHIDPTVPIHMRLNTPFSAVADKFTFNGGYNALTLLIMIAVFVQCATVDVGGRLRRADEFLGNLTYPLYLCHPIAIAAVGHDFAGLSAGKRAALALSLALITAFIVHYGVERPISRLRLAIRTPRWRLALAGLRAGRQDAVAS
jgi:peptidoglycan/LPS O-acetylase OafA/YrhL